MSSSITTTLATLHGGDARGAHAGACQLVVVEGPDTGRAARLSDDAEAVVGSDPGCDLVLTDERVSRRHVAVTRSAAGYRVRDLASRNGTLVGGSAITEAEVPVGTTLKIGRTFVRIQPRAEPVVVAPSAQRAFGDLVGESLALREVFAVLELASRSDVTVLLEGETGTGKELAARALHEASARRRGPFVALDCGALPEHLVESELFGHEKGAFTGAHAARQGAFVRASGGTLFLDELDAVPLDVQARLLRALEERKVRPVGGDREVGTDLRVVAASQRDLATAVSEGRLRADLYYRLAVLKIPLPPLRERREDIGPLVVELLRRRGLRADVQSLQLGPLLAHDWPGNVRELRNVIERALALQPGASDARQLHFSPLGGPLVAEGGDVAVRLDLPYREAKRVCVDAFEKRYVEGILAAADGNVAQAARNASMDRKHLHELLARHRAGAPPSVDDDG